ncbi:amino acid ABC transporter ATP-binding protein [Celeribacter ethanolicus]|uniref:Amino acid ABC transporter ATP-binding protein n=1 Tax=Celeribacter ethanolicus TaxID=1758178 RepID=A0A291GDJ1_9RHOB|nr:amino acid ABC transporter ATP-binding protein [Celeribacter ethanolicus]ATG48261.1 amino acid ABC transporter ATP-binding protein [Celeribacter ethanolicus]TNE67839.1 MAG: amino acid ABC transporter ATP-binding protein [Paracoccaceae bacterium]
MIRFENIHKSYGHHEVLKGIDAEVEKGQVVCLIGASGSGKSTLLRCVNGLEDYQSGGIFVDEQKVDAHARSIHDIRTRVAMVFQRFNLFPHMTALENVMEGPVQVLRENKDEVRVRAEEHLRRVGLADKMDFYPSALSGGQQQRVAIARALAMRPEAILLDEPTSALDPEMVGEVLTVLRDLAEEHMTMLIVTHEIQFAREVANNVFFLDSGRIAEQGTAEEVLTRPQNERTQEFLRRVSHLM